MVEPGKKRLWLTSLDVDIGAKKTGCAKQRLGRRIQVRKIRITLELRVQLRAVRNAEARLFAEFVKCRQPETYCETVGVDFEAAVGLARANVYDRLILFVTCVSNRETARYGQAIVDLGRDTRERAEE